MPLIFAFVARGSIVLSEYTPFTGNFNTVAAEILTKITNPEPRFTISCDGHNFNFLVSSGFTYLVVADDQYGRQIPFAFLERVKDEFDEKFAEKSAAAPAHSLDRTFGPRLKSHMEYVQAHPEEISKIAAVQKKVNNVKDVMMENIEKVLERGEKIELMVGKMDDLQVEAATFQKKGRGLRNKMCWQNWRWKICVIFALLLLGVVIFCVVCFSGGNNCVKKPVTYEDILDRVRGTDSTISPPPPPPPVAAPPPPPGQ